MDVRVGREAGGEHRNEGEARARANGQGQIWAHAASELALRGAAVHARLARRGGAARAAGLLRIQPGKVKGTARPAAAQPRARAVAQQARSYQRAARPSAGSGDLRGWGVTASSRRQPVKAGGARD